MGREIERKFLLANNEWRAEVTRSLPMRQGYLATTDQISIRIRQEGEEAFLNLKSATLGISRDEFEFPLPAAGALEALARFCGSRCVEKIRHFVPRGQHLWEIDEFLGENAGLFVAEVELSDEQEVFERPVWLGTEVSLARRYYNVCLLDHPYVNWSTAERAPNGGQPPA
jgi:adenylate cyclase